MVVLSFCVFLLLFVIIGALSTLQSKNSTKDYHLAGRNVSAWLVGLSAVATSNSGFMFIGIMGFTYNYGISTLWLIIGWILGDFIAFSTIHKKLRIASEKQNALSYAGALAKWNGETSKAIRIIGGIITIVFLSIYAAAQLSAGSKALHIIFGWHYNLGAILGASIVLIYCYAGGIRASIWTDAAQSIVMIFAMMLLAVVSILETGSISNFLEMLYNVSPEYMSFNPGTENMPKFWGPLTILTASFFVGYGVTGQPHIMIRVMTLDSASNMNKARNYYFAFYTAFCLLTIIVGLSSRILIPENMITDTELALPILSKLLLPQILIGVILAGIFAATMSTADSQILSCSAALTHDLAPESWRHSSSISKMSTIFVTIVTLLISLYGSHSVFSLTAIGWNSMACAFTPLLSLYVLGYKISEKTSLTMIIAGITTIIAFRYLIPNMLGFDIQIIAGFIASYLIFAISRLSKKSIASN